MRATVAEVRGYLTEAEGRLVTDKQIERVIDVIGPVTPRYGKDAMRVVCPNCKAMIRVPEGASEPDEPRERFMARIASRLEAECPAHDAAA